MSEFIQSAALMLVLLNPFLLIVYLIDVVQKLDGPKFRSVLIRAAAIAAAVLWTFAVLGDAIFSNLMQASFASFQIFGGIVFLLIGLQFVFKGPAALEMLRGDSDHLAGAIAMPVMIGPGTISAAVVVGEQHQPLTACGTILVALLITVVVMVLLKRVHDWVRPRQEDLIEHYIEIAGRITALFVGTISVQMIMQGIVEWLKQPGN